MFIVLFIESRSSNVTYVVLWFVNHKINWWTFKQTWNVSTCLLLLLLSPQWNICLLLDQFWLKFAIFFLYLDPGTVSRKIFNSRQPVDSIPYDHDENKYQRRGAIDWFTRWFWWVQQKPTCSIQLICTDCWCYFSLDFLEKTCQLYHLFFSSVLINIDVKSNNEVMNLLR